MVTLYRNKYPIYDNLELVIMQRIRQYGVLSLKWNINIKHLLKVRDFL